MQKSSEGKYISNTKRRILQENDKFTIPEEIRNMSLEELREEKEKILIELEKIVLPEENND